MEVFKDYAYYYNSFYKGKDYKSEAATVDKLLIKYGNNIKSIINFGCGTGRHDIELCKMGYQCKGIDISSSMIEIAVQNAKDSGCAIGYESADVRCFESKESYDAVISLFHVMSYQNSNEDISNAFQSARKLLREDGIFLFDVWYGPGVLSDKPSIRVREIEDENNKLVRIARPIMRNKDNVVEVNYEVLVIDKKTNIVKEINETHNMRYFFKPEIEMFLEQAGLVLVDILDCNTLSEPNFDSWTCYFIARPKGEYK